MRLGVARYSETLANGASAGPNGAGGGSTTWADFAREIEEDDERNRQLMAGRSTLD